MSLYVITTISNACRWQHWSRTSPGQKAIATTKEQKSDGLFGGTGILNEFFKNRTSLVLMRLRFSAPHRTRPVFRFIFVSGFGRRARNKKNEEDFVAAGAAADLAGHVVASRYRKWPRHEDQDQARDCVGQGGGVQRQAVRVVSRNPVCPTSRRKTPAASAGTSRRSMERWPGLCSS